MSSESNPLGSAIASASPSSILKQQEKLRLTTHELFASLADLLEGAAAALEADGDGKQRDQTQNEQQQAVHRKWKEFNDMCDVLSANLMFLQESIHMEKRVLLTRTKQQASSSQAKITNGDVESFLELRRIIQSIESILASPKRADQEEEKN